ncbi:GntR family transcriptional regulator [Nioella aestuarii]|uniref:GntR family transcriptional regulator n=1 Tax=Nioella aestuarii TaxID=1662864 RepID=UPI003D7FD390
MAREPLYKKAETEILRRITSGEWPEGMRLGNEFELAEEFKVSQGTMRRALMTVEAMGYLNRKPGRGTVVAVPKAAEPAAPPDLRRLFLPNGDRLQLEPFRANLTTRAVEGTERDFFSGPVHALTRTLKCGGERFALEEILIDAAAVPEMEEDQPVEFLNLLHALNLPTATLEDRLHAEVTSMSASVALACDRHTGLLCLTRIARDSAAKTLAVQTLRMAGPANYRIRPA